MAKRKSSPRASGAKPSGRKPHKPPAEIPAEFVTPSQALDYLTGPKVPRLAPRRPGTEARRPGTWRRRAWSRPILRGRSISLAAKAM
jgi:hypothetical protein